MATSNNILCDLSRPNILCDLSHLGLLEISGADAVTFLQGQVTNDVNLLTGTNAHYSAYCNPKGRMLALFLAFAHHNNQQGNHLHLQFNRELLEPIMKRLKMYVMRSKVEIKDVSDSIIKFGLNTGTSIDAACGPFNPNLIIVSVTSLISTLLRITYIFRRFMMGSSNSRLNCKCK